ncbi:hypothetical protein PHIN109289_17290 [Phaeobacter inhibens]
MCIGIGDKDVEDYLILQCWGILCGQMLRSRKKLVQVQTCHGALLILLAGENTIGLCEILLMKAS